MDFGAMAEMLQGMGGGGPGGGAGGEGGAGGLAGMLNNPMMMQMAQQMMANGGMERLMQNPSVANMVGHSSSDDIFLNGTLPPRTISEPTYSDESRAVWGRHAFNGRADV